MLERMALWRSQAAHIPATGAHATSHVWETDAMYRDIVQWSMVRRRILEGVPRRQVARETGISRTTIRKMLKHPRPQPYGPRSDRYPKLGPHTASIQRMLQ